MPKTDDGFQDSHGRDPSNVTLLGADTLLDAEQANLENRPGVCTVTLMVAVVSVDAYSSTTGVFYWTACQTTRRVFATGLLARRAYVVEASIHCSRVLATFEPGRTPEVSHLIPQRMVVLPSFGPTKISQHEQMALRGESG